MSFKEITLPSGAVLKLNPAPFEQAKNLYQAILEELKPVSISTSSDVAEVLKNLMCYGFSSKKVEQCLWECMKRCQYNNGKIQDLKVDKDIFNNVEVREDYVPICIEVVKENVGPFVKSLYAEFSKNLGTITPNQA